MIAKSVVNDIAVTSIRFDLNDYLTFITFNFECSYPTIGINRRVDGFSQI